MTLICIYIYIYYIILYIYIYIIYIYIIYICVYTYVCIYIYIFIYAEMWPTMGQQCDMLASLAEDMMSKQPLPATHGCSSKDGALFSLRPQNSELLCQALKSLERVPRLEADLESRTE